MKILIVLCFAVAMLATGVVVAQDTMQHDSMNKDMGKTTHVTGKISDDGKTFVSDSDNKTWTIENPDAVKGHEGHHVTLTAKVNADKSEVWVASLKMAK